MMSPFPPFSFQPIGILKTCFHQKFGIPRQSQLVKNAPGILYLNQDPHFKKAIQGLEEFSHIWIIFLFHCQGSKSWKPSVRPPRLGGAEKRGLFSTRSPHRPNPIGISVVKLEKILIQDNQVEIHISGMDCLNDTPVLDIKPYLPYADSFPEARSAWAEPEIKRYPVTLSHLAQIFLETEILPKYPHFKQLMTEILSLDPRPAFQKKKVVPEADYGFQLHEFNICWRIASDLFFVFKIEKMTDTKFRDKQNIEKFTPEDS